MPKPTLPTDSSIEDTEKLLAKNIKLESQIHSASIKLQFYQEEQVKMMKKVDRVEVLKKHNVLL